ncbi:DUF3618 domain-containing protein [Sinorhizobium sp. NFACC03]|uniref:DUF3618 domain-containing protein n=1 Tax=Sinorhizobium sp. NFACC03 TaxID=1566295 RepID=UPI00088DCDC0|nr:DUF3618 domain-containing protein [Sinorhizobium sp. NFACC03]SDA92853.1 Protein of unknown function [Sinorhizobium sp. NFACC03]
MTADTPSSAELQREIETDRQRIEEKLHAIQERMSPGELMDEVIAYARGSGGAEFLTNLSGAMKANPIPVALTGIGLAWLLADPASRAPQASVADRGMDDYPLATVKGNMRRVGPVEANFGERYSHFEDQDGSHFRARTDAVGRRAGHFVDPSGTVYRGFADASGQAIEDIRDETGGLFDEATGWASATWREMKGTASSISGTVSDAGRSAADSVRNVRESAHDHGAQLNAVIVKTFRDQPLVGGALAFAIGAAIGAALPATEFEDEAAGEVSDRVRDQLVSTADAAAEGAIEGAKSALDEADRLENLTPSG